MTTSEAAPRRLTAAEFAARPAATDDRREELVRGVVETVTMTPPRFRHGLIQLALGSVLVNFLRQHPLGRATVESGLITSNDPDTVRGPDVAYWSFARVPADIPVETYPDAPADIVGEVLSPDERYGRLQTKVAEYLARGVRRVWVLDPDSQTVTVYRPDGLMRVLGADEQLTGEDVLPGFACRVAELFA